MLSASAARIIDLDLPPGFDGASWMARWERMQGHYLVRRSERFETMARLVADTQPAPSRLLDLGCGPGCLMAVLLETFPSAEVTGVDFDPTILLLGRAHLASFAPRAQLLLRDLRDPAWADALGGPFDAVLSATALHWLEREPLAALYGQIAALLRPGGILLNADHVGSEWPTIQHSWERHRERMRAAEGPAEADDWDGFWAAYGRALGLDEQDIKGRMLGGWSGGVEDGLPLAWHLDVLRDCGFVAVDCFWRSDADAIYGGIRQLGKGG